MLAVLQRSGSLGPLVFGEKNARMLSVQLLTLKIVLDSEGCLPPLNGCSPTSDQLFPIIIQINFSFLHPSDTFLELYLLLFLLQAAFSSHLHPHPPCFSGLSPSSSLPPQRNFFLLFPRSADPMATVLRSLWHQGNSHKYPMYLFNREGKEQL